MRYGGSESSDCLHVNGIRESVQSRRVCRDHSRNFANAVIQAGPTRESQRFPEDGTDDLSEMSAETFTCCIHSLTDVRTAKPRVMPSDECLSTMNDYNQ